MKYWLSILLVLNPLTYIREMNRLQEKAERAYQEENYRQAASYYEKLTQEYRSLNSAIYLNLAHCYFHTGNYKSAFVHYQKARGIAEARHQSVIAHQCGMIYYHQQNYQKALDAFKLALQHDPHNRTSAFNYELLKKLIEQQELPMPETLPPPPQTEETPEPNEPADEAEDAPAETENPTEDEKNKVKPEKLDEIKLNREKAESILDALKNQEVQYIQELIRERKKKKPRDKSRPNW